MNRVLDSDGHHRHTGRGLQPGRGEGAFLFQTGPGQTPLGRWPSSTKLRGEGQYSRGRDSPGCGKTGRLGAGGPIWLEQSVRCGVQRPGGLAVAAWLAVLEMLAFVTSEIL